MQSNNNGNEPRGGNESNIGRLVQLVRGQGLDGGRGNKTGRGHLRDGESGPRKERDLLRESTMVTTKVETLQEVFASSVSDGGGGVSRRNDFHDAGDGWKKCIPKWKCTFKGASIVHEGKTYWWCKHHAIKDRYDGLYMNHKPEDHEKWKTNKKYGNKTKRGKNRHPKNSGSIYHVINHNNKCDPSENYHQQQQQQQQQKEKHHKQQKYTNDTDANKLKSEQGKPFSLSKNDNNNNNNGSSGNTVHVSTHENKISSFKRHAHGRNKSSSSSNNDSNVIVAAKSKKQNVKTSKNINTPSSAINSINDNITVNTVARRCTHESKKLACNKISNSSNSTIANKRNKHVKNNKNSTKNKVKMSERKKTRSNSNNTTNCNTGNAMIVLEAKYRNINNKREMEGKHCQNGKRANTTKHNIINYGPDNGWLIPILGIKFVLPNRKHNKKIPINKNYVKNIRTSRPLTSGYLAAKAKVAGKRKAVRKERNISRLVRQHNSTTIITKHAAQRYRERRPAVYPIYAYNEGRVILVTFLPMKKYTDKRQVRDTVVNEIKKNHQYSNRSQLPKKLLSWREAASLREEKGRANKVDTERKRKQRERAYMKRGCQKFDCNFFIRPTKRATKSKQSISVTKRATTLSVRRKQAVGKSKKKSNRRKI